MYKTNVKDINELQNFALQSCYKVEGYLIDKTNANMLTNCETKKQWQKLSKKNNKMRNWKKINKELKVNGNEYIIAKKVWGVK